MGSINHGTFSDAKFPTLFASGKRIPAEELAPRAKRIIEDPIVKILLKSIPGYLVILNSDRQILAGNEEILKALNLKEMEKLVGLRLGEAFECVHAVEGPSGCGTSRHCRTCGAVLAMLSAYEKNEPLHGECALSMDHAHRIQCKNLALYVMPMEILGERCLEFVFHDISDQKMHEALDQLFIHDLRNAMTGVQGWSEIIMMHNQSESAGKLLAATAQIMCMIENHSTLIRAEAGELCVNVKPVTVSEVLFNLEAALANAPYQKNGVLKIEVSPKAMASRVETDPDLLNRILLNMVKNAFEASGKGEEIRVGYRLDSGERPYFWVHNQAVIPEEVQLRMFQRAYSTKGGAGRGFGTYGMKILGQNYLRADVGFSSTTEEGTSFYIRLPEAGVARAC